MPAGSTVNAVIEKFMVKWPAVTQTQAMQLFTDANRELCTRLSIRNVAETISLVANQQEYTLPVDVYRVHSCYCQQSPTYQYPLWERSTFELDVTRWGWRNPTFGTPYEFYLSSTVNGNTGAPVIGLYPTPSLNTAAGYPNIQIYTTSYVDLGGSDTVPTQLLTDNFYLYKMFALWAAYAETDQLDFWTGQAEAQFHLNHEHWQNMQSRGTTMFFPAAAYMPTRTR